MTSLNKELGRISTNWLPRAIALSDLNTSTSNLRINQLLYATATEESTRETAKQYMIAFIDHIAENYDTYDALRSDTLVLEFVSEEEQALFEQFDYQWEAYQDLSFSFIELTEARNIEAAITLINEDGQRVFADIHATLNTLVDVNKKDAVAAAHVAEQTFHSTRRIVRLTVGFTTALSILVAALLIRVITVPLGQLVEAVDKVAKGNLDVELQVKSKDEIGRLAQSFNAMTIGLREAQERVQREATLIAEAAELKAKATEAEAKALRAENERKTYELEEARRLQLSMLPPSLPVVPNLDVAVHMGTATEVGGDYYDFSLEEDGTLTLAIGDATGHGLHAGTMVTAAKSLFKAFGKELEPVQFLKKATRALKQMGFRKMYMAMTVAKIKNDSLLIAGAGMPYAIIHRAQTGQLEDVVLKGMPLGSFDHFPYRQEEIPLNSGDTILFMSDGIPERFNAQKDLYGEERVKQSLVEAIDKPPEDLIAYLLSEVENWANGYPQEDDETLLVLKVKEISHA